MNGEHGGDPDEVEVMSPANYVVLDVDIACGPIVRETDIQK